MRRTKKHKTDDDAVIASNLDLSYYTSHASLFEIVSHREGQHHT